MYHSRAAALLTGDFADRVIDLNVFQVVGAGTPANSVAFTYTVGANIQAILEQTFLEAEDTAVANQVNLSISLNRGAAHRIDEVSSKVAAAGQPIFVKSAMAWNILLPPASTIQGIYGNTDVVGRTVQITVSTREIDR